MIEFTDVVKSYTQGNKALNGVTMQIEDGEFCFLIGPSGSGKSTIIKLITGELKPTSGTVHVNGYSLERIRKREVPYLRRTVGVVFQDYRLIEKMTVYENVAFAMRVVGAKESEIKERVPYVLELVGLESKMNRHPNEMSGGDVERPTIRFFMDEIRRGKEAGVFRKELDEEQVVISLITVCFANFSNRYTLSKLFSRPLDSPEMIEKRKRHTIDLMLTYICR